MKQIEQLVRISREFGREVATGKEAREICKIGVFYDTVEETLAANGFAPNAKGRQQGFLRKVAVRRTTMAQAIRMHKTGGPEVLQLEEVAVGSPGPGQARIRHVAVGLNFADTYFRTGLYPMPLPNGIGVEASGVVEAVGEGVTNVAPGDRVTYTGFVNTLGAYSTERIIPAAPLIKLPRRDLLRDRGGDDDARSHLGVPDAPDLAAARRATPSCCTPQRAASA